MDGPFDHRHNVHVVVWDGPQIADRNGEVSNHKRTSVWEDIQRPQNPALLKGEVTPDFTSDGKIANAIRDVSHV